MISVIVPAYNDVLSTLRAVNSLRAYSSRPVECLVQDDASPEREFKPYIPQEIAQVERNADNLGFAGNCNAAAQRAHLPILLFVNQDVWAAGVSENWNEAIASAFRDPEVGVVAPRLLFPDGRLQSAGGVFDAVGQPVHRCLGWKNLEHREIACAADVTWATGAVLAVRASLFKQLGGFDTGYRMYFEDVDFCLRVREAGYRVRYEPAATFVHAVGSTGGSVHFVESAQRFKATWVDTGKVKPEVFSVTVRYW